MRKVIIEFKKDKYLVICREDRLVEFKRGEEDKIVDFVMDYLGPDHKDLRDLSRIKAEK